MTHQNLKAENTSNDSEITAIEDRYDRRKSNIAKYLYSPLSPSVYMARQELERVLINDILNPIIFPFTDKKILEIGCGNGMNLMEFIKLGFLPENITGNELLDERVASARNNLPSKVNVISGDATKLQGIKEEFDIVYQSTVFTSILDDEFQRELADTMWDMVKPGGGILWYDFIYNNPSNSDVRGVPLKRIKELFPDTNISFSRVTLAPPISRRVTKIHPSLYTLFNLIPILRTHILCWISKPI